jgi:ATP-binding cassette subfamily F protein uup
MRSPNFLVLDEPTNDLDIVTLNLLEEYLRVVGGCVIIVSHDRYFMDKVVDHLLVFNGGAEVRDFPGNYTQYREWREGCVREERKTAQGGRVLPANDRKDTGKRKLTYKEQKELETLEEEIVKLEGEKTELEGVLSSGELSTEELWEKSRRVMVVMEEIETKTVRWMELSEEGV